MPPSEGSTEAGKRQSRDLNLYLSHPRATHLCTCCSAYGFVTAVSCLIPRAWIGCSMVFSSEDKIYSLSEGILRLKYIKFCRFLSPRNWPLVIKDLL